MTSRHDVRGWLFMALTTDIRLDELEKEGIAVRPPADPGALQRIVAMDEFPKTVRDGALAAMEAYILMYLFENSVRDLIRERMTENHGPNWWEGQASDNIKGKVEDRKKKEGKNRWHMERGAHPIHYTDFSDLQKLIINNWDDFQDLLPDQGWLKGRLDEVEQSRNIIAHTNVIEARELQRLKLYVDDWKRQTGG